MSFGSAFHSPATRDTYVPREATERCAQALDSWAGGAGARVAVLWGPSGIGKTLMMRRLARRLVGQARTVYVPNPIFGPAEISLWALDSLGVAPDGDRQTSLLRTADELRRNGTDVVLLIDDVELLPIATEEWLLTKAANHLSILMTVTDSGRRDRLVERADGGATLLTFATPMNADETADFVRSHLARLDLPPAVLARFGADTLAALHERGEGLPVHVQNEASMLLREAMEAASPGQTRPQHAWSLGSQIVSVGPEAAAQARPHQTRAESAPSHVRKFFRTSRVALGMAFLAGFVLATALASLRGGDPVVEQRPFLASASLPSVSSPPPTDVTTTRDPVVAAVQARPDAPAERAPTPARVAARPAPRERAPASEAPASLAPGPAAPSHTPPAVVRSPILVAINARPWGNVRIDGDDVGETPMAEIPLDAGTHRFEVRLADGRVIAQDIEISERNRYLRFE